MKKRLQTVSFILIIVCSQYLNAQSQTTQADILKTKLLDSICHCFNNAEIGLVKNAADASKMLSECITHHMSILGDYSTATGIPWANINKEKLQELTTYIASEVYKNCPAIKAVINQVRVPVDTEKSTILKSRLTDSICLCITKTDTNSVNNLNDAQIMLTRCIVKNESLMEEYAKSTNIDLSTDSNSQDFANSIASDVFRKCAAMQTMIYRVQLKNK